MEFWLPKHPIRQARKDHTLRICAPEPFRLRWSADNWKTWQDSESRATGVGGEYFDLVPSDSSITSRVHLLLDRAVDSGKATIIAYKCSRKESQWKTQNRGKVVVVTGASAGVGRAVVTEFARQGAHIGLIARGRERLEATKREVEELGGKALVLPTDVADAQQVEAAAERVEQELGPIDIWVNDAMTTIFAPFLEITPDEFKRATEVTYLGQVYGTMAALKRMHPRNRGSIVQVGSALAFRSIPCNRLLRGQARHCGIHGLYPFGAYSRWQRRAYHGGDAAGDEHAAIQLVPHASSAPSPARAADLPAGGGRARHCLGGKPQDGGRCMSVGRPWKRSTRRKSLRPSPIIIWRNMLLTASRHPNRFHPIGPTIYSSRCEGEYSAHGIFDDRAKSFSVQSSMNLELINLTAHRGLVAFAGMALTGCFSRR